jgi:hypothetical protein
MDGHELEVDLHWLVSNTKYNANEQSDYQQCGEGWPLTRWLSFQDAAMSGWHWSYQIDLPDSMGWATHLLLGGMIANALLPAMLRRNWDQHSMGCYAVFHSTYVVVTEEEHRAREILLLASIGSTRRQESGQSHEPSCIAVNHHASGRVSP